MPGLDGTGPRGMGPMTGGARGRCNPNFAGAEGYPYGVYGGGSPYGYGRGRGGGFGRGFGFRGYSPPWPYVGLGRGGLPRGGAYAAPGYDPYGVPEAYPPPGGSGMPGMSPFGASMTSEQEIEFLRNQTQVLKEQMGQIDARIQELGKEEK